MSGRVDPVSSSSRPITEAVGERANVTALPNLLSLFRIAIVPIVVLILMWTGPVPRAVAAGLFIVASITDYLDGWLARRRKSTTVLGQFLDPLPQRREHPLEAGRDVGLQPLGRPMPLLVLLDRV